MEQKAERRHQDMVVDALHKRRDTDIARAREIFAAFRVNLRESRDAAAHREIRSEEEQLFPDDQQRQRRRDLAVDDRPARQTSTTRSSGRSPPSATATPRSSRTSPRPPSCSR